MLGLSSSSSSGSPSLSLPAPYRRGILSGCAALDEAPGSSWLLSALSLVSLPKTMDEDRDAWRAFGIATCTSLRGGAFGNCRLPIKRTWLQVEPYYPSSRYTPLPLMPPRTTLCHSPFFFTSSLWCVLACVAPRVSPAAPNGPHIMSLSQSWAVAPAATCRDYTCSALLSMAYEVYEEALLEALLEALSALAFSASSCCMA